jgi:hypothetical protein
MLVAPGTLDFEFHILNLLIDGCFADCKANVMQWKAGDANIKKAGRFPVRVREGPAKNLLPRRQKNAQQDTKTQCFLCWYFYPGSKRDKYNLAGFLALLLK